MAEQQNLTSQEKVIDNLQMIQKMCNMPIEYTFLCLIDSYVAHSFETFENKKI